MWFPEVRTTSSRGSRAGRAKAFGVKPVEEGRVESPTHFPRASLFGKGKPMAFHTEKAKNRFRVMYDKVEQPRPPSFEP